MSPGHVVVGVDTCLPNPSPVLYPHAHPPLCHTFLPAPPSVHMLILPTLIYLDDHLPAWLAEAQLICHCGSPLPISLT